MRCPGESNSKGNPHGHGTMAYPDGSEYAGEWRMTLRQLDGALVLQAVAIVCRPLV